jgi:hypothetical protein
MLYHIIEMMLLARMATMYTHINLVGVASFSYLSPLLQDIVRASTFLILIVILTVWLSGDLPQIYGELVDSFAPVASSIPTSLKMGIAGIMDILLHVVPCFIVGLPQMSSSFLYALVGLLGWYGWARPHIHDIYSPSVPADRGIAVASATAIMGSIILTELIAQ